MEQVNALKDGLKEISKEALFPQASKLISKVQQECKGLKKLIAEDHK